MDVLLSHLQRGIAKHCANRASYRVKLAVTIGRKDAAVEPTGKYIWRVTVGFTRYEAILALIIQTLGYAIRIRHDHLAYRQL